MNLMPKEPQNIKAGTFSKKRHLLFCLGFAICTIAVFGSITTAGCTSPQKTFENQGDGGSIEKKPESQSYQPKQGCNGSEKMCAKRLNEVTFLMTHNAMSSAEKKWTPPNHKYGITRQLYDGVRGFMLDTHYFEKEAYLCHSFCGLGKTKLSKGLKQIADFLKMESGAIIPIIFESYISAKDTKKAFEESDLLTYTYTHTKGKPWPTLGEMKKTNKRVIVFTLKGGNEYPWYHRQNDFAWENHYAAKDPKELNCKLNRGSKKNALFILNHFLTAPFASAKLAQEINPNPFFLNRIKKCQKETGQRPNFISVDYYSVGSTIKTIRQFNDF